jgi:hypothetical protein
MRDKMEIEYVQFYENNLMGIKDEEGNIIVPANYNFVAPYSDESFQVTKDGKHGFVGMDGKEFIKPTDEVECYCDFSEGLAAFRKNEKWGYINKQGKVVVKEQFQSCENFSCGLAKVRNEKGMYGFINKQGKLVIKYKYTFVTDFINDYASFQEKDSQLYGLIDANGKIVVDPEYVFISEVEDGKAVVQKVDGDDYCEGVLTIGGEIEWNDNLEHINEFNRCSRELAAEFGKLVDFYFKKACPCAFPRFRKFVEWKSEDRFFDAELLWGAVRDRFEKTLEMQDPDKVYSGIWEFKCPKCNTEYRESWRQYSMDFEVTNIEIFKKKIRKEKGQPVDSKQKTPVVLGFAGYDDIIGKYDDQYEYAEIKDLINYLKK